MCFKPEKILQLGQESSKSYNNHFPEILEGATYSCGKFLSLLAEGNFKDLEDVVELVMFEILKRQIKRYQDLGYTVSSIGSTENAKAEILDFNTILAVYFLTKIFA
ncbi:unnamed protein product [Blepharisma stoltei]|uniref:Uncharacterized protein n=1 Tax=Blepharisma stoltei TaxID=1481888 RepID=A0AAU9JY26_9CILI|nr:unnamed protein product [Blepharisma stoltei]